MEKTVGDSTCTCTHTINHVLNLIFNRSNICSVKEIPFPLNIWKHMKEANLYQ